AFDVRATQDCNANGQPDSCEIAAGAATDCDGNGIPDACELSAHDCNNNGVLDACESGDCNNNGTPDICELPGHDCNGNGMLDECEALALNRALQFDGVSDYASVGTASLFNLTVGMTFEAWVRPDSINSYHVILSKGVGSVVGGYGFITRDGKLDFVAYGIQ